LDPGERKSLYNVIVTATGLGARFDAASGQRRGPPGRGYRETRDLPGAGRAQYDTRRYFEQLAKIEDDETAKWMRALEQPERATWQ